MTTMSMREVDGRQLAPADVDEFRAYVRAWLPGGLPRAAEATSEHEPIEQQLARHRVLQRKLWDAGLAGILYPVEYGGLGLTREHQRVFLQEADGFETPTALSVTHGILIATLLDFGSEEQKRRYIPGSLRDGDVWVQLLSEPGAGSDMAGALTRAVRDGESYVINGSKIWTTFGHVADFGMSLCRTNPDVPKHRGLSMIIVPLQEGPHLTVNRIRLADGNDDHFCEEFFEDVVVPVENLIGQENDGWSAALRLLFHERNMMAASSYHDSRSAETVEDGPDPIVTLAQRLGVTDDPAVRQLVGEALTLKGLELFTIDRVSRAMARGALPDTGASILRLMHGEVAMRRSEISVEVSGPSGVVWDPAEDETSVGRGWLGARIRTIGGGTNEAQRNVISERILGLPREPSPDKDRPFSEVRHNR